MRRFNGRGTDSEACRVRLIVSTERGRKEISVHAQVVAEGLINGLWSMDAGSHGPTLNWSTRTPSHLAHLNALYSPRSTKLSMGGWFLPIPSRGVRPSVCPSVLLPVTLVYCIKTSNHMLKLFSRSDSHTISVFHTKPCSNILTDPLTGAKIAIFDQYLVLALITAGLSSVVNISTTE